MLWSCVLVCLFLRNAVSQFQIIDTKEVVHQIAGIFEPNALTQKMAFNESIQQARLDNRRFEITILQPSRTDSYSMWRELCKRKSMQPLAIFGPQNPITDSAVRKQCYLATIPHIQATWQPYDPDMNKENELIEEENYDLEEGDAEAFPDSEPEEEEDKIEQEPIYKNISINFYPDSDEIAMAYAKLLKYYKWHNFAAMYEDDYGLHRLQKILAEHTTNYPIPIRRLDPDGDNHKVFKELEQYKESRILLDCHVDRLEKYMKLATELNMVNSYQHYILLSMDSSVIAEKFTQYSCNVTWLSLAEYDKMKDAQHVLSPRVGRWTPYGGSPPVTDFQLEALVMDDVANHLLKAVRGAEDQLGEDFPARSFRPQNHICEQIPWQHGAMLQDKILKTQTMGVTGNVEFDDYGRRVNYTLYVNEIHMNKIRVIGRWFSATGDEIVNDRNETELSSSEMTSKKFIIISRKAKPYFYDKAPCEGEDCPNDGEKFEGFSVDLVKEIFKLLREEGYDYTYEFLNVSSDYVYGGYDPIKKKWSGLIGDLLDKKADLAVCDLTITEERKKVVDFSVPIMTLGISILYTKEHKVVPGMFSFLNPYTVDVWMYTATAYCVVSVVLFICARVSPADWENPQPCDKDPEELENIWNFKNCAWLTMGSIMTQGCDILPKAIGTRWVCGMWWFFAVIVCQTYIAQLSASMTSAMENEPINSVEDLAKQTKVLYGAIDGGSTFEFFKSSSDKMFNKIYENMKANPVVLVNSNDEGERRVLRGNSKYAFFMESSSIEYKLKRNCELKKVGGELDSKDYGVAMPTNSPFRTHINRAILKLKELTILDKIKTKWWEEEYGAKELKCPSNTDEQEGDLEMENLIGAFVVLIIGLAFCLIVTAAEFMDEVRNIVVREQVSHKEAFVKELRASLNFFQLQKPVLRNPSRAPSLVPSELTENVKLNKRAALIENFMDLEKIMN